MTEENIQRIVKNVKEKIFDLFARCERECGQKNG